MPKQSKVVVVGSSNADMVAQVSHAPEAGETILCDSYSTVAGGKGANQAVAAARMGAQVTFVACVGLDALGEAAIQGFRDEGIDIRHVEKIAGSPSGTAFIWVDSEGENRIVVASGANAKLSPEHVDRAAAAIREADVLLCQLETPLPAIRRALQIAHEAGVTAMLNPAPAVALDNSLLEKINILTPNLGEACLLVGEMPQPAAAADAIAGRLIERGVGAVCITLGGEGCLVKAAGGTSVRIPASPVKVVDTTAAGDTFAGALAALLASGRSLEDAAATAVAAASLACIISGAQPSIPKLETVEVFIAKSRVRTRMEG